MTAPLAEIDDGGKRINVYFPYSAQAVRAIKAIPGRRFIPKDKGGPYWAVPLDLKTARLLREEFGLALKIGSLLRQWARDEVRRERNLRSLAHAETADLQRLSDTLPDLAGWLRPYQRADVAFMARQSVINANQPGLGKTVEVIGAVFEAGIEVGAHLVIAPVTSLRSVWEQELLRWQSFPVLTADSPEERRRAALEAARLAAAGEPFWLVINPDTIRYWNALNANQEKVAMPRLPELERIDWASMTIDEYHKMGLANPKSLGAIAFKNIGKRARRKFALSGTPMGGVPLKLWGTLHWLDPEAFPSKWQWAAQWLEVSKHDFGTDIGDIQRGRENEFYEAHAPYLIRRTKAEVLPDLPPKQYVDVWCDMVPKQRKQYKRFAEDAEVRINDDRIVATSVLAEYARLKQFASAEQKVVDGNLLPLPQSGKLAPLFANIEDRIIEGEQVIISSQSRRMADMVGEWLSEQKINGEKVRVSMITGDTDQAERATVVREFQQGDGAQAIVMTTTAGGVAITLDAADSVHILDETWNPDDQEQLEDRVHRASRMHQVTIYYYRTRGTVEEYIHEVAEGKQINSKNILDVHRQLNKLRRKS